MKTSQKGFISPLLLALIAILLVGGGVYVYVQKKQTSQQATVSETTQATSTAQTITEESTTTATFTGYYAQKQVREIYDGEDFGVKNCDTFIAYKSNDPLFQFLSNWSPGTVDTNGNLSLNISFSNVSSDVKNKILISTKEQPILLTIQKKVFPGKGLPVCGSVVDVISVT